MQIILGFFLAAVIGLASWKAGALSPSGAVAATITGGLIFGLGGISWAVLLLAFFISSSLLSRLFRKKKAGVNEKFAKGSQRDWAQVLANGGLGAILVLFDYFFPNQHWFWIAYAGAMAAVNADTWATELGVLSPSSPRLITTGKTVESGTSGGISFWGSLAALAGALFVACVALFFRSEYSPGFSGYPAVLGLITLGGFSGSFFDSLLGATVQAIYFCPTCVKETERYPRHACGTLTSQKRGWKWLNNDLVNFLCSLAGAMVSTLLFFAL